MTLLHPIVSWAVLVPGVSGEFGGDVDRKAVVVEDWRSRPGSSSGRLNAHAPRYSTPSRSLAIWERTTRSGMTI